MSYQFPFGRIVNPMVQKDQTPKKVFVLGVYASAVHAKWIKNNRIICKALSVASEPCIFWDGKRSSLFASQSRIETGFQKP